MQLAPQTVNQFGAMSQDHLLLVALSAWVPWLFSLGTISRRRMRSRSRQVDLMSLEPTKNARGPPLGMAEMQPLSAKQTDFSTHSHLALEVFFATLHRRDATRLCIQP